MCLVEMTSASDIAALLHSVRGGLGGKVLENAEVDVKSFDMVLHSTRNPWTRLSAA
jgi:hypothetical protein